MFKNWEMSHKTKLSYFFFFKLQDLATQDPHSMQQSPGAEQWLPFIYFNFLILTQGYVLWT